MLLDDDSKELGEGPAVTPGTGATQTKKRPVGRPPKYPALTAFHEPSLTAITPAGFNPSDGVNPSSDQGVNRYSTSRQKEINGLLEKGVFRIIPAASIPSNARLFNSRFVDEVKHQGTPQAYEKSRLVVQAYNDQEKTLVLTQSPTIQRVSQRLILCISAIKLHETDLYLRDISQAYVQSTTTLNRKFYVRPPKELVTLLSLSKDSVLQVVKPLYGVPEAGNHWFKTYHAHHVTQLRMNQSTYDPCLLYSTTPFGLVGLQTDDTLLLADQRFSDREKDELKRAKFTAKEREKLTKETPIKFNGGVITLQGQGNITLTQASQCTNLSLVNATAKGASTSARGAVRGKLSPKDQYVAQCARGAYIASVCQPEASFDLSFAA
jgi:hypothetical protein